MKPDNKKRVEVRLTPKEHEIFTKNMEEAGIKTAASFIVMRCCTRNGNSLSMKDMVSVNMSLETIREETERITNTDMKHRIQSSLDNIFSIINKGGCDNGSVEDYK